MEGWLSRESTTSREPATLVLQLMQGTERWQSTKLPSEHMLATSSRSTAWERLQGNITAVGLMCFDQQLEGPWNEGITQ